MCACIMLMVSWSFAAYFVDVAGPWIRQSHGLNTANAGSSRDNSLQWTWGLVGSGLLLPLPQKRGVQPIQTIARVPCYACTARTP